MSATKVLLLLSVLFSSALADDEYGGFGCPDPNLGSNINATDLDVYKAKFLSYFPLRLQAAAEHKSGREFSCIRWEDLGDDTISMHYYDYGAEADALVSAPGEYSESSISFDFTIPTKGLLGSKKNGATMTAYLLDDQEDHVTFNVCRQALMAHYMSTFVFLKDNVDPDLYDWRCFVDSVDLEYDVSSEPKGICPVE